MAINFRTKIMTFREMFEIVNSATTQDDVLMFNKLLQSTKETVTKEICNKMSLTQCDIALPVFKEMAESLYAHNCKKIGVTYSYTLERIAFLKYYYLKERIDKLLK